MLQSSRITRWLLRLAWTFLKKEAMLLMLPLRYNLHSPSFIQMPGILAVAALWYTGIRMVMLHPLIFAKKHPNRHIVICIWIKKETPLQASACTVSLRQVYPALLPAWSRLIKNTVACRGKSSSNQLLISLKMDFPSLANKQQNLTTTKNGSKSLIQMEPPLFGMKNGRPEIFLYKHNWQAR